MSCCCNPSSEPVSHRKLKTIALAGNPNSGKTTIFNALTGMRHNEVCDLLWEHVDWRQKLLRLPDSKTGKRDVVVSDEVMALLGRLAHAKANPRRGYVVCSRNGRKLHSLKITWLRVRQLAGIPDVRLHDLRHSVASDDEALRSKYTAAE